MSPEARTTMCNAHIIALTARGFTRQEAKRLLFLKYRLLDIRMAMPLPDGLICYITLREDAHEG